MGEPKLLRYGSGLFALAVVWLVLTGLYGSALVFAAIQDIGRHNIPFRPVYLVQHLHFAGWFAYLVGIVRFAIIVALFVDGLRALQEYGRHLVLEGSELRKYDSRGHEIGRVDLTQAQLPPDLRGELVGTGWRAALGTIVYTGGHKIVDRKGGAVLVATRYLAEPADFHSGVRKAIGLEGKR
jgi:hypothetical protein